MCSICNNISLAKMIYPDRGHQGGEGKKKLYVLFKSKKGTMCISVAIMSVKAMYIKC